MSERTNTSQRKPEKSDKKLDSSNSQTNQKAVLVSQMGYIVRTGGEVFSKFKKKDGENV